jgi:hypothetical protein
MRQVMWLLVASTIVVSGLAGHFRRDLHFGETRDEVISTPSSVTVLDAFMPIFLHFDGIYYLYVDPHHGRSLTEQDLGERLGQVRFRVPDDANMINRARDGDATVLEAGTPIYAVKEYATSFRLAAKLEGQDGIWLYEAARRPTAATNADMLDVAGKVVAIDVYDPVNRTTLLATICDVRSVERLMDAILAAPLHGGAEAGPAWQYYLVLRLQDGTASGRTLAPASAGLANPRSSGIAVSSEVIEALEQAVVNRVESPGLPSPVTATNSGCRAGIPTH